jgi:cytidylate kinase
MPNGIVVFDGLLGAGKSTQAQLVAQKLRCCYVEGDHYFLGAAPGTKFVEGIRGRREEFRADIRSALKAARWVILATICGRDVIQALSLRKTKVTYVYVESNRPVRLKDEVFAYHIANNPRIKASLVYRRKDELADAADQITNILGI